MNYELSSMNSSGDNKQVASLILIVGLILKTISVLYNYLDIQ